VNQNYINTLVTDIGKVLLDSAKQTFGVKLVNTNYSKKKKKITKGDKPWVDIECKRARQHYRKMKRKKGESQYSYNLAKNSEKEYKKVLINKAMKNYRKKMTKKMQNLRFQNTGEFSTNVITLVSRTFLF
jgi:predicted ATP-dependent endonuclease of OLD family